MISPSSAYRLVHKLQPAWNLGNFPCTVTHYHLPVPLQPSTAQSLLFSPFTLKSLVCPLKLWQRVLPVKKKKSWKIDFLPVGMASYTVCVFAKPLILTSYIKPAHCAQPNKVLVAIQLLTVNCWPQLLPHWYYHLLCCHGEDGLIFGLNTTEILQFPYGEKKN